MQKRNKLKYIINYINKIPKKNLRNRKKKLSMKLVSLLFVNNEKKKRYLFFVVIIR